ncbi:hypothetical protein DICPUDRAFT_86785 [Dictyostelium purpureum]|uniref:GST C-terminal domain-containing protein n=1 Tax=Dictyostelium purpureum TaxID=5786 RepID=F0ZDV9_DICPU|nr:uncharacterized protein DICPUDRAFT_86785 [Dictyostelium purpureum]EGC37848.1 hypothetical protein DICPUDRAFT_86785 [Dictyostelium purpureum]|eukprot:XP_003285598.1 hypothetical protein DICPUDRAFT_86785 [Dictyostelium purpureum]
MPKNQTEKDGQYTRKESSFRDTVSKDHPVYQPESGRYHLYVCFGCPFAHRALIMRVLKGLEDVIDISVVDYVLDRSTGWKFSPNKDGCTVDKVNNFEYLKQVYLLSNPNYEGRITVPVLFDKKTKTIVNNESAEIIRILNSSFNDFCKTKEQSDLDYYPKELQTEIDKINSRVYENVNNGVYKTGFAQTQEAYDINYIKLFETLDYLESHLSNNRYLLGKQFTEADIRLFPTLIRFDAVYFGHFKANRQQIKDFPNLSNYLKELYQMEPINKTVNFHHIKNSYYVSMSDINPTKIVPNGPDLGYLNENHNRLDIK